MRGVWSNHCCILRVDRQETLRRCRKRCRRAPLVIAVSGNVRGRCPALVDRRLCRKRPSLSELSFRVSFVSVSLFIYIFFILHKHFYEHCESRSQVGVRGVAASRSRRVFQLLAQTRGQHPRALTLPRAVTLVIGFLIEPNRLRGVWSC